MIYDDINGCAMIVGFMIFWPQDASMAWDAKRAPQAPCICEVHIRCFNGLLGSSVRTSTGSCLLTLHQLTCMVLAAGWHTCQACTSTSAQF